MAGRSVQNRGFGGHRAVSPQFSADDEFEGGPNVAHRADFDINESKRQGGMPDGVFGNRCRDFGGLLRPRYPYGGVGPNAGSQFPEFADELGAIRGEEMNDVGLPG